MLLLHILEDGNARRWIDELLTIHAVEELLDSVGLLQLVELGHGFFPGGVERLEFGLIRRYNLLVELVQIRVLSSVPRLILHTILDKKFINLWLEHERNIDQVLTQLVKKASGALGLKCLELVKVCTQLLRVGDSSASMLTDFIPDRIDVSDFVFEQKLINLWLEHERNVDQVFAQLVKKAGGALSLESLELVKVGTQLL